MYFAYAATLEDIIEDKQVKIIGFADDHALRKTCKPTQQDEELTARCLEQNLSNIKQQMDAMKLCMNTSKTEIIIFGLGVQLCKLTFDQLSVVGDDVSRTSCIKYLGVHMDGELKLHKHITEKCKIAPYNLYSIRCIRDTLTVEACKQVVQSLVISHLDYCNSIFMGMPKKEINQMQKIQNSAACLILNRSRWSSASSALKDLYWFPIRAKIEFKILVQVFKCLKSQAPQYLINKLVVRNLGESGRIL